jgi:FimV-like protein
MTSRKSPGQKKPAAAEPALEPVTTSEVRTKLDLARQYLDMGDPDSARHMLDEVLKEGDAAQREEAQQLLDSIPGSKPKR